MLTYVEFGYIYASWLFLADYIATAEHMQVVTLQHDLKLIHLDAVHVH